MVCLGAVHLSVYASRPSAPPAPAHTLATQGAHTHTHTHTYTHIHNTHTITSPLCTSLPARLQTHHQWTRSRRPPAPPCCPPLPRPPPRQPPLRSSTRSGTCECGRWWRSCGEDQAGVAWPCLAARAVVASSKHTFSVRPPRARASTTFLSLSLFPFKQSLLPLRHLHSAQPVQHVRHLHPVPGRHHGRPAEAGKQGAEQEGKRARPLSLSPFQHPSHPLSTALHPLLRPPSNHVPRSTSSGARPAVATCSPPNTGRSPLPSRRNCWPCA